MEKHIVIYGYLWLYNTVTPCIIIAEYTESIGEITGDKYDEIKLFELCVYVGRNLGMTDDALNVRGSARDISLYITS